MEKLRYKALTRHYNKKWLEGYKADLILGSFEKSDITIKEDKCNSCKIKLYFADTKEEHTDLMKKNIKPICANCLLELDTKENILNEEQRGMVIRYLDREW